MTEEIQIPPADDAFAVKTGTCHYCSCTDERACLDPETHLPCQMVTEDVCSLCAGDLYCGYEDCPICLERGVVPKQYQERRWNDKGTGRCNQHS